MWTNSPDYAEIMGWTDRRSVWRQTFNCLSSERFAKFLEAVDHFKQKCWLGSLH